MKFRKIRCLNMAMIIMAFATITGCGANKEQADEAAIEQSESAAEASSIIDMSAEDASLKDKITDIKLSELGSEIDAEDDSLDAYDKFFDDEIEAIRISEEDGSTSTFKFSSLPQDPEEWDSYSISDKRVDLDNDGVGEVILNGPYGGMYLDERDGKIYVLAEGEGTAGELSYVKYDGKTYIIHSDASHGGRQVYNFDCYNGKGEIEETFELSAMYWDSETGTYDENSDFSFKDKKITMEEYESLKKDIFGK